MELNSNSFFFGEARIHQALPSEIALAHTAQCGLLSYDIFARCGTVFMKWRDAVADTHRMLVHLEFVVTRRE